MTPAESLQRSPDPLGALLPLVRGVGGLEQAERARRGAWVLATTPRPPVALTPHEVVHRQDKLVVRHYPAGQPGGVPVVVVPSLINRASICDLEPDRSLVGGLAGLGHPTYLVDWGDPAPENAGDDVAHVVLTLLARALRRVAWHAGRTPVVLGYCQGGTLSAVLAALRPESVAGLVALNAPIDLAHGGRFAQLVREVEVDLAFSPDRLVPVEWMRAGFKLLDPMGNFTKLLAIEAVTTQPVALARALARERWLEENVPCPGAFTAEFIREVYQRNALMSPGAWQLRGEPVDLRAIRCPVLVVCSEKDFIAPRAACQALAGVVGSDDVAVHASSAGHIGLVVGSAGPRELYPLVSRWARGERDVGARS